MICANIDMGSNTMRLSLYRIEQEQLHLLLNKKKMVGLAAYVENKCLTQEGIGKACDVLLEFQEICENFGIVQISVFATASLRNVSNTQQAREEIRKRTGISVQVLSGQEEARLDFIGATHSLDLHEGLLVDIGGGSTELVWYVNREIVSASSMPIGSLQLYQNYIKKLFPKKDERADIRQCVQSELNKLPLSKDEVCHEICGVGGTARATLKLQNNIFHLSKENRTIEVTYLKDMLKILKTGDKTTLRRILYVVPDRIHTILPGMLVLYEIAQWVQSKKIHVSTFGVREGYMFDQM